MSDVAERSKILKDYSKLYNAFSAASGSFQSIYVAAKGVPEADRIFKSPVSTWMASDVAKRSQYVVVPEEASEANMAKIINSAEFMRRVIPEANEIIKGLRKGPKLQLVTRDISILEQKAAESKLIADMIEKEAPKTLSKEEVTDELSDYYRSLADIKISSQYYEDITNEVRKEIPSNTKKGLFERVWDRISWIWERTKKKVGEISERIKGLVAGFGGLVSESLDRIRDSLSQTKEKIVDAFASLSDRFHDFIIKLTDQMFKFLTRFGEVAKTKGYSVSQIDIKIPSVKFEFVNLFFVSIPIPKVEPPEITVSIQRDKSKV